MKKRILCMLLAVAVALTAFGCNKSDGDKTGGNASGNVDENGVTTDEITLSFWHYEDETTINLLAEKFMDMLKSEYAGKRILCVSHGGFIKQTLKVVLGLRTFRRLPACENTAICRYAAKEGEFWQLVCWNDAAHLKSFNRSTGW